MHGNSREEKQGYMTKPIQMKTQGAEGKKCLIFFFLPMEILARLVTKTLKPKQQTQEPWAMQGEQSFLKACTGCRRSALDKTHLGVDNGTNCYLHYGAESVSHRKFETRGMEVKKKVLKFKYALYARNRRFGIWIYCRTKPTAQKSCKYPLVEWLSPKKNFL